MKYLNKHRSKEKPPIKVCKIVHMYSDNGSRAVALPFPMREESARRSETSAAKATCLLFFDMDK